jgi:hypothetical protein
VVQLAKVTSAVLEHVERAGDAIKTFHTDGVNPQSVLAHPQFQAAALKVAREELAKAIALIERAKWKAAEAERAEAQNIAMTLMRGHENGSYVECTGAHGDRSTLHRYRRHVGRWISVPIEIDFEREARADIFRIVSYPNRRILFGLHSLLWR